MQDKFISEIERLKTDYEAYERCLEEVIKLANNEQVEYLLTKFEIEGDPSQTLEVFLREKTQINRKLYFNLISKEFGDILSRSCKGINIVKDVLNLHQKRIKQFESIKEKEVIEWYNGYVKTYSTTILTG